MKSKYIPKEYVDGRVGRASSLGVRALALAASQLITSPSPLPRHASITILYLGIR